MWKSIEDPPSTNRDVIVSDGEGGYIVAFYDKWGKAWHISDSMFYSFEAYGFNDANLWCEIPKINQ